MPETKKEAKYSPKKAATLLISNWLEGGKSPKLMTKDEMTTVTEWKINDKRHDDILIQVDSIMSSFKAKIENLKAAI